MVAQEDQVEYQEADAEVEDHEEDQEDGLEDQEVEQEDGTEKQLYKWMKSTKRKITLKSKQIPKKIMSPRTMFNVNTEFSDDDYELSAWNSDDLVDNTSEYSSESFSKDEEDDLIDVKKGEKEKKCTFTVKKKSD